MKTEKIKVAVTYRVCQHWRAPMFARLNRHPELRVKVFHSSGMKGTKLINGQDFDGFEHKCLLTLKTMLKSTGRSAPALLCPGLPLNLLMYNPDVILAEGGSNFFNNILIYLYALVFRKPVIWWGLGGIPGRKYKGLSKLYINVTHWMTKRSKAMLGYSCMALKQWEEAGIDPDKCFKAVNCVDTEKVLDDIEKSKEAVISLREALNLKGKRVVLFVGALTEAKSIQHLITAYSIVQKRCESAHLLIVGDGPYRSTLEKLAEKYNISNKITFTGQIIDLIAAYYELGDIFVMPGLGGLAISEAMTHGLPVICSIGDGCEVDLVGNEKNGYRLGLLKDQELVNALTEKIELLLEDDSLRSRMGSESIRIIKEEHNVNTYIGNIVSSIKFAANKS